MNNLPSRTNVKKKGFTLIEASTSITIMVLVLGLALGGFLFALKSSNESDVQSELDIDVQMAMERLKRDLRLSSLDEIFYYPAGPGPYIAISFPLAEDSDGDGLYELEADGRIIWDKTVIYHVWPSTPHQLRVTTFNNRDNTLTDVQRQAQLNHVVETGSGVGTYNGNNVSTYPIFENLLDWTIRPKEGIFDAYSPTMERETTSLGFALLADGAHTFKFQVAGKNEKSSGYKIGIDQLTISPCYAAREAEAQLPVTSQSGATAVSQYIEGGSWKGNHQLYFPATAKDASFTLTMDNDQWEETNFGSVGYEADDTKVTFDDSLSPKDFVVQLQGNNIAWNATEQTDSIATSIDTNNIMLNSWVFVHLNGSELLTNGNWIAYNGSHCKLTFQASSNACLQVDAAYIGKTASTQNTTFGFDGSYRLALFDGHPSTLTLNPGQSTTSDWINMDINKTNNYMVVYKISSSPSKCFPMTWPNNRTSTTDCLVNGIPSSRIYGLSALTVSYPEKGTYTSQIFDTRLASPVYEDVGWNADLPTGTALGIKVRTGNQPDLSDASEWESISASQINPHSISASYERYVQFQATLYSDSDGLNTPKLKDLTVDWIGETQLVNISGTLTKGPDYGVVSVSVDNAPLQSALSINLRIYKDLFSLRNTTKRITSSLIADIRPRNTGQ